jgi:hypothetical protein
MSCAHCLEKGDLPGSSETGVPHDNLKLIIVASCHEATTSRSHTCRGTHLWDLSASIVRRPYRRADHPHSVSSGGRVHLRLSLGGWGPIAAYCASY